MLTERWTRHVVVSSLVGLACVPGGAGSTAADTEPGPMGSTSDDGSDSGSATEGDSATDGDSETDGDSASDTEGDDCQPAWSDCPDGEVWGCPRDLVGTELVSERILGSTCSVGCPGPTTSLELYDSVTAERVKVFETEPEIIPAALAVAPDGSVVMGGWYVPNPWEPPSAATLHRISPDGTLSWSTELEGASFEELVVQGDEIIGFAGEDVAAYALADGTPTWTIPTGLIPLQLAVASDGTLYVYGWEGNASFQGLHVLAYDPAHALLWDVLDAPVPDQERRDEEMIVDEAGGIILAARVTIVSEANDVIELRKLDPAGVEVWSTIVDTGTVDGERLDDEVYDIVALPGGGVLAVGRAANARGGQPLAVAFDADGNELWSDTSEPASTARLQHAVRVGDQAFALGCGDGEWMVPYPP